MKLIRKIPGLLIAATLTVSLSAQENECYFKKAFFAVKGTFLRLTNKYGDVNIVTVNNDSVSVCARITIAQNNNELVRESRRLISINMGKLKDTIAVSTSFDRKFFSQAYRKGRKSFSVDYFIAVPSYININVSNEFGNISIEELSGSVNIRLSQGILSAKNITRGNIKPLSFINADHGKISIDELNWMELTLRNCSSVAIGKAQALLVNSGFSKIRIEEVSSLVANSKSDNYSIDQIRNLVSESLYSVLEIEELSGQLKSNSTYGSVKVSDLMNEFESVDIVSDHALVEISTSDGISFKSDITVTNTFVDFPIEDYPGIIKTESNNTTIYTGVAGDDMKTKSLIKIRATSGKLSIHE
jgi:hypothetical protein